MSRFYNIRDRGPMSRRGDELLRVKEEMLERKTVNEVRVLDRIKSQEEEIDKILNDASKRLEDRLEAVTKLGLRLDELRKVAGRLETTRQYAAEKQFHQSVRTSFNPRAVGEDIHAISRSSANIGEAVDLAREKPTLELEMQRDKSRRLLVRQQQRISEAVKNVNTDEGKAKFRSILNLQDELVQQAGLATAAIGAQRKLGIDTQSTLFGAQETISKVQRHRDEQQIREDVSAGRAGSRADVQEKLKEVSENLVSTFERLTDAIHRSSDASDASAEEKVAAARAAKELGEEFSKLESQYKTHQQTIREMDRQGIGGGGSRLQAAGGIISDVGTVTQGLAQGYRYNYITSELQQTQNRIGYAQLANQRFKDVYGSTQGDMSALRRVLRNEFKSQSELGTKFRDREQLASGVETAGAIGSLVGKTIDSATSLDKAWQGVKGFFSGGAGAVAGRVTQVGAAITPEALRANQLATNFRKDISAGQVDIRAQSQYRAMLNELNKISDFSSQQTFDYYRDITTATRGIGTGASRGLNIDMTSSGALNISEGGRRESVMSALSDPDTIRRLANNAGIGTRDIPGLLAGFKGAEGTEFTSASAEQELTRAGRAARLGLMDSPEQYVQARGALAGLGGGGEDLEKIMAQAVATGMDSSKNIVEMVGAVQQLNQTQAAAGIDAVAATTTMMGRGVEDLLALGIDKNQAVRATQAGANKIQEFATSRDMDLFNVIEYAEIQKAFPDARLWEKEAMATADPKVIQQIRNLHKAGKKDEAIAEAEKIGLGMMLTDQGKSEELYNISRRQVLRSQTGFGLDRNLEKEYLRETEAGTPANEMRPEVRNFVNATSINSMGPGVLGVSVPGQLQYERDPLTSTIPTTPPGRVTAGGEAAIQAGAIGDAKTFADGMRNFTEAVGDLSAIGEVMKTVAAEGLNMQQFKEDVTEAAKNMTAPINTFSENMAKFNTSIGIFTSSMNSIIDRLDNTIKADFINNLGAQLTKGTKRGP